MTSDYTPKKLRFDRDGVEWLIYRVPTLRDGVWPGDSPYENVQLHGRRYSCRSRGEFISLILAELSRRVMRCGTDGLVVEQLMLGKTVDEIARERFISKREIESALNKVIRYCASGEYPMWWTKYDDEGKITRQAQNYDEFKRQRLYRRKG